MMPYKEYISFCPLCGSAKFYYIYYDFEGSRYVKCANCTFVFQNPRLKIEYEKNYWGKVKDPDGTFRVLENERESKIKNQYRWDLEFVKKLTPGTILDSGCGFGFFLSALDKRWNKYGVELSEYCVSYIRKNFHDINIKKTIIEESKFNENFFDVIYSYHVIEHVEKPKAHICKLRDILKKDGYLIISTPNICSLTSKIFKGNYRLLGNPHICMFSPKTLGSLLAEVGFKIIKISYPFFKTDYFTFKNCLRLFHPKKISPPFFGNIMTFYLRKV